MKLKGPETYFMLSPSAICVNRNRARRQQVLGTRKLVLKVHRNTNKDTTYTRINRPNGRKKRKKKKRTLHKHVSRNMEGMHAIQMDRY